MSKSNRRFNASSSEVSRKRRESFLQTSVIRNDDVDDEVESKPEQHERRDPEGFVVLHRTPKGEQLLEEIRRRRAILESTDDDERPSMNANKLSTKILVPTRRMLNAVIEKIQDNKFGKGMDERSPELLRKLLGVFLDEKAGDLEGQVNEEIRKVIKICKSYYEYDEKQRQFLSDEEYDQMVMRWRSHGFEEPTGYLPNKSRKTGVKHPRLHNNMDKSYRIYANDPIPKGVKESDSIEAWLIRSFKALGISSETVFELEVSPKIDGTSGNGDVTANGQWSNPQTRGDENESLNIRGMDGLELIDPKLVHHPFAVQFEIFCTEPDRIGASAYLEKDPPYVGCRQASSGIVNRLCTGDDNDLLQYVSLYPIEADGLDELSYVERMNYLSNLAIVPKDMIKRKILKGNMRKILKELERLFAEWGADRENHTFTYDGMVLTFVDDEYQKTIGRQGRTNLYQMALKFDPASAVGRVAGIHLDFGKKGYRTLQVDLEHAIFLDGVRYDHIPVLSAKLFRDHHLRVGDDVRVNRVGDVIPSITVENTNHGKVIQLPTTCPDCGHPLQIKNSKLYCGNPQCVSNLAGRIEFFLKALEIDRYGENFSRMVVETFDTRVLDDEGHTIRYGKGVCVRGLRSLFELDPSAFEEHGITTKDAQLFLSRLNEAMDKMADYEVLGAMGIPDVGRARAFDILKTFGGIDEFIRSFNRSDMEGKLKSAIGDAIGTKVYEALNIKDGWEELQEDIIGVRAHITRYTDFSANRTRIGHTGLKKFPEDIQQIIEDRNFLVVDGKNFDILITADINSGSGKMRTAQKRNLPIMTLDGFRERYGN